MIGLQFGYKTKFRLRKRLLKRLLRCHKRLLKLILPFFVGFMATCIIRSSANDSSIVKSAKLRTEPRKYQTGIRNHDEMTNYKPPSNNSSNYPPNISLWKQSTLLNISKFRWIMNNKTICQLDKAAQQKNARLVIILVHSARDHFVERLTIRRSYGSLPMYKKWVVRIAFLLGEPETSQKFATFSKNLKKERETILKEQQKYGDLVMGSFIDVYRNLTYKHIMGYKWVFNFCPHAQFVLKVDDDIFVDLMSWLDWRTVDLKALENNRSAVVPDLFGFKFGGVEPRRNKDSKWYATQEEWPDHLYPNYCVGWVYGITIDLMKRLYLATQKVRFFWIDDVFVTGALLEEVKTHGRKPKVKYFTDKLTDELKDYRPMCEKKAYFQRRKFKQVVKLERGEYFERDMMCLWNKTMYDTKYEF